MIYSENIIIFSIGIPCSFLSLLSTSFVFCLYFLNPTLRIFPFRLILYLQTADFIMSLGQFLNILKVNRIDVSLEEPDRSFLCLFQAFLCQYGALSTIVWAIIITTMMIISLYKKVELYEKNLVIYGFIVPGLYSVIPFFFDGFGNSGVFCWISAFQNNLQMNLLMIFFYYIFLWFAMIYNSIVMFKITQSLKKFQGIDTMDNLAFINKIKYFPIFLIIWWIGPTIHRIYQMVSGEDLFFMAVLHVFCESSYGCVNTLLYAINPRIREIILQKFKKNYKKSYKQGENIEEPLAINQKIQDAFPTKTNKPIYI